MADKSVDKLYISDEKLRSLWKYAVNLSLGPDNEFPAFKLYYILLKKEIEAKHLSKEKPVVVEKKEHPTVGLGLTIAQGRIGE